MEAKETVMNATTKRQFRILITKPRFDYWNIEGALELQAELSFKAGIREERKRMTKALRELHKQGWTLAEVIEAEDTCGED